jgi:fatty acid desaturase
MYYAMQVEATHNFACGPAVSVLAGGLDCHIEHHLSPRLPPNRLRQVRAEVEAACAAHGARSRRARSWGALLRRAFGRMVELSFDAAPPSPPPAWVAAARAGAAASG